MTNNVFPKTPNFSSINYYEGNCRPLDTGTQITNWKHTGGNSIVDKVWELNDFSIKGNTIKTSEIDFTTDTLQKFNDSISSDDHVIKTQYSVVDATHDNIVGQMLLIGDSLGHMVTEILTTSAELKDGVIDWNAHSDTEVNTYIRRNHVKEGGTSSIAVGSWSKWTYYSGEGQFNDFKKLVAGELNKKVNTSDVVQQTGDSTTSVMSQKAISDNLNAVYTFLKDIHPNFYKDSFIISDLDGNVAFEVDKIGNTKYVGKVTDVFSNYNENKFLIVDKNGYIVAKFEDKGATIAFKDPTNFLERKVFYTLGDSLSAANKYQLKLAEITGATFDAEANIDTVTPISVGGTTTMGANNISGFQRARNLVSLVGNKDVVIIENINDMNHVSYGGDINSAPYTEYPDGTNNGATKTLYGAYKWLCEYLITNLPSTKLFWMIPNRIDINYSSPETRPDGTINMDYYTSTQAHKKYMQLVTIQKEVAAYYGIPVLDMIEESGINYVNGGTFFNDNNVHPKDVGYYRWGETIARLLTSK